MSLPFGFLRVCVIYERKRMPFFLLRQENHLFILITWENCLVYLWLWTTKTVSIYHVYLYHIRMSEILQLESHNKTNSMLHTNASAHTVYQHHTGRQRVVKHDKRQTIFTWLIINQVEGNQFQRNYHHVKVNMQRQKENIMQNWDSSTIEHEAKTKKTPKNNLNTANPWLFVIGVGFLLKTRKNFFLFNF